MTKIIKNTSAKLLRSLLSSFKWKPLGMTYMKTERAQTNDHKIL